MLLVFLSLHVLALSFTVEEFNIHNVNINEVCEIKKSGASYHNMISDASRTHEEYSNEWTVKIIPDSSVEEIAERNGFINLGLVL